MNNTNSSLMVHLNLSLGLLKFGKNWAKFLELIPTRSGVQIRSHAQKCFNKLENQYEQRTILGELSAEIMGPPIN